MKLGFICLNLPGHLNPMTALARQLQERNHEVVFLYSSSANGLPCVPGDDRDPISENRPEVSKLQGNDALGFAVSLGFSPSFSTRGVSDPGRGSKWTSCLKGLHYKSDLSVLV